MHVADNKSSFARLLLQTLALCFLFKVLRSVKICCREKLLCNFSVQLFF